MGYNPFLYICSEKPIGLPGDGTSTLEKQRGYAP